MANAKTLSSVAKYGKQVADATKARNAAIVTALSEGVTYRAVADAAGLSHEGVRRIHRAQLAADKRAKDRARRAAKKAAAEVSA